jgi:hypothetical protein
MGLAQRDGGWTPVENSCWMRQLGNLSKANQSACQKALLSRRIAEISRKLITRPHSTLDLTTFANDTKTQLKILSAKLAKCFGSQTTQWRKSGLLIDLIDSKSCKPIIDEIDRGTGGALRLHSSTTTLSTGWGGTQRSERKVDGA